MPLMDPLVTLFGSVHEKLPETGSMRSMLFPNFGSMFSTAEPHFKTEQWDEESVQREGEGYTSEAGGGDSDDNLQSPLISRQTTSMEKDMAHPTSHGSVLSMRRHSSLMQGAGDAVDGTGIGGGWQLAWKWTEREDKDGNKEGGFKRIFLHQEGVPGSRRGSLVSLPGGDVPEEGGYIHAAALVSQPALYSKELMDQHPVGPCNGSPISNSYKRSNLFAGINGVLYYTPQILEEAGCFGSSCKPGHQLYLCVIPYKCVYKLSYASMHSCSDEAHGYLGEKTNKKTLPSTDKETCQLSLFILKISVSVLMGTITCSSHHCSSLLGLKTLLLTTIPVLILSLVVLIIFELVTVSSIVNAAILTACVIVFICCFVSAYGPIPNILCSEIFPTRVRGLCIAICAMVYWIGDIIVTYTLPVMLSSIGLVGIFSIYAVVCAISWVFVFLKVPETKGMPLEVITEFFAVGARQAAAAKNE
ncbi:hypothetical protein OIU77_020348 [Salix suchowensis]|uniref:Major facilitator superfamily (MFS) profile domain-containing protein n=1 Tax=Salix suchowensis TaxID=1278906 RepID=A0ABQ9CNM6_9ROSI|nr:hypothetical protein OIU77_020348 [Salix suchowensis]